MGFSSQHPDDRAANQITDIIGKPPVTKNLRFGQLGTHFIKVNIALTEIIIPAGRRYFNLPLIADETILESLDVSGKEHVTPRACINDYDYWF